MKAITAPNTPWKSAARSQASNWSAAKYTEPGGHIWFAAQELEHKIVLTVKDSGLGIPTEMLPRIFDPFAQAERSCEGLGLGLAVAKQLVELHGGAIEAKSAGAGSGSEFTVTLPLASGLPQTRPAHRAEAVDDRALPTSPCAC